MLLMCVSILNWPSNQQPYFAGWCDCALSNLKGAYVDFGKLLSGTNDDKLSLGLYLLICVISHCQKISITVTLSSVFATQDYVDSENVVVS